MLKLLLGIGLQIIAFAVFLLSEFFSLPFTLALFAHLSAVYFFTHGLEGRLIEINLRRELCFFFTLIFPLAGMAGILFYVFILKRIEHLIVLPPAKLNAASEPDKHVTGPVSLEEDSPFEISQAFVRRLPWELSSGDTLTQSSEIPFDQRCRETDYLQLEHELSGRIALLEETLAARPDGRPRLSLARDLLAAATLLRADPALRRRYLKTAGELCDGITDETVSPQELQTVRFELLFQEGNDKACVTLYDEMKKKPQADIHILLRVAQCLARLKDFRKLAVLSRLLHDRPDCPEKVRELTRMWVRHG